MWLCNALIGKSWRLLPKITRWFLKCMIITKITHARLLHGGTEWTLPQAEHLQRVACIMITGAIETTPTKVQEMFLDRPSLGTEVEVAALMAVYRLPRPNPKKKIEIGHNRILANAHKMDSKFSMIKDYVTQRSTLSQTITIREN